MSMTYVHSQYMEGAGWWGQWWEGRKSGRAAADQKGPPLVLKLDTRKIWKTGRENDALYFHVNEGVMVGSAGLEPATSCL
jgi:hypothetical protein